MRLLLAASVLVMLTIGRALAADPEPESAAERCLAQTMYWEARTEGRTGMLAVGWVVLNRMRNEEFPRTICSVVRQGGDRPGCQFSYWCDGERDTPKQDEAWAEAKAIARQLLAEPPPDPTGGALFFHAVTVARPWKAERTRTARIGRHVYYR
jgi:spore germination cell wall hydrolase CwlJ-like protein